ncbi:MAG: M10 family metallopeptidase C-terminal domain-containing protein [Paracoccaceae bacterium]
MSLSANEQYLLELINRARLDPTGEAARLGTALNSGLTAGTIPGTPVQVLAPNEDLNEAAEAHGQWMLDTDTFSHTGSGDSSPGDRMKAAGYTFTGSWSWRENLSWTGTTGTLNAAAAVEQQYVNLYNSPGHRANTFAAEVREIGLAQVLGKFKSGSYDYNASMVVENFALSGSKVFVTGVVYDDADGNDFYGIGEGVSGLKFKIGSAQDTSEAAGGYSIGLAASSDTKVSISQGDSALGAISLDTTGGNVKLDMVREDGIWTAEVGGSAVLKTGLENARLLGVSDWNLTGNGLDNHLTGNSGANYLRGAAGNDTLDGGAGADTMSGSTGDDVYIVDSTRDVITGEFTDSGMDTVLSSVSYTLRPNLENLTLTGTADLSGKGNSGDNFLLGNTGDNLLTGCDGNDTLSGGGGADTLSGGYGDDLYIVDSSDDVVKGEFTDSGSDTVMSSVSFKLLPNLEDLVLTGSGAINGTGNARDNTLAGNSGANLLSGEAGNDVLSGGAGADTLVGGTGADTMSGGDGKDVFLFKATSESTLAAPDTILDFARGQDLIDLSQIDASTRSSGDQAFTFIGTGDFAGTGMASAGELRYEAQEGGGVMIEMDVNGDGKADMHLLVASVGTLGGADFLL